MKWSLKMPLWSWWWILGVKHWYMSLCGRLAKNGFTKHRPWLMNALGFKPSTHWLSISVVFFWSYAPHHASESCSSCSTKHHEHWLFRQQVIRHCSGKSAMYTARIGYTLWTHPSAYIISFPSLPANFNGSSNDSMHWWNSWWVMLDHLFSVKHWASWSVSMPPAWLPLQMGIVRFSCLCFQLWDRWARLACHCWKQ